MLPRTLTPAGARPALRSVLAPRPPYPLAALEWYIKLFLGVHFADNLA
jgi:hypothetical protein